MPRQFVKSLGKHVTFPDNWSRDQIDKWISEQSADDGIDAMDALGAGWKAGWLDTTDAAADYLDLLGADNKADAIREWVQGKQRKQTFAPEGFVEKLLAGIGAAPGAVVGMAPAVGVGAATSLVAGPVAGAAAGFGLHSAVRGGDGDLLSEGALKEGLIGAAEGAAFGGLGKIAGLGRIGHGAGAAGIGAGGGIARSAAHGEELDTEDIASQAAVMGLLGGILGGKRPTLAEAEQKLARGMSRKTLENEAKKELGVEGFKPPEHPMNLGLMDPDAARFEIQMVNEGRIKFPERISHDATRKAVRQLREEALKDGRPDVARKIIIEKYEHFNKELGDGKLSADVLWSMEEFSSAGAAARKLWNEMEAATAAGNSAKAAGLKAQYDQVAQEAVALAGVSQGYGTAASRALNIRNAARHDLPLHEQAILFLEKKNQLDVDTFNKLMSSATDDEIRAITKTAWEPTLADKGYELWMMSLLSNPLTWGPTGVNMISNLAKDTILKYPTKVAQAIVDPIRAKKQGRGADETYNWQSLAEDFKVDRAESGPALRQFIHDVVHGRPMQSGKLELQHGAAIGGQPGAALWERALGGVVRTPGRWLEAADQFFRSKAQAGEALRIATEKMGKKASWEDRRSLAKQMIDNPKEFKKELIRIKRAGDEAVFTQSLREQSGHSAIAKLANVAQNLKQNQNPLVSVPAKLIVPFTRTPANIAIDALKHTPFGRREYTRLRALKAEQDRITSAGGDFKGSAVLERDLSEQIAKSVIGTTMMSWALGEALQGNITGGGPTEYPAYQKWLKAGNQPYSMKLGDKWVSYQRIEPFASLLGMAADVAETGRAPSDQVFDRALASVKDNIANKTFLLGVENLSKAWANPKRYGTTMAKSLAATFVPAGSVLGATARGADPHQRITSGENFSESMINAIKSRVPGARATLEPRYSVTGDPIVDEHALFNFASPFRIKDVGGGSIVDKEINRLGQMGHDVPNMQRRKRVLPGEKAPVRADAAEYATFHEFNRRAAEALERIMLTPSWSRMSPEAQSRIIMSVFKKYSRYSSKLVRRKMIQNRR